MISDINLIDLLKFDQYEEIKIGDILSYKNKIFININFIPIFRNVQFLKELLLEGKEKKVVSTSIDKIQLEDDN